MKMYDCVSVPHSLDMRNTALAIPIVCRSSLSIKLASFESVVASIPYNIIIVYPKTRSNAVYSSTTGPGLREHGGVERQEEMSYCNACINKRLFDFELRNEALTMQNITLQKPPHFV